NAVVRKCADHIRAWRAEGGFGRGLAVFDHHRGRVEGDLPGAAPKRPSNGQTLPGRFDDLLLHRTLTDVDERGLRGRTAPPRGRVGRARHWNRRLAIIARGK